jgi:8-oxo-dGTP diphosphatase
MLKPTEYVLGFLFDLKKSQVILIRKLKPNWQKNLLNGVGGKIEEGETPINAMVREFKDETGIDTVESNWKHYATMSSASFNVAVFKAFLDTPLPQKLTDEEPIIVSTNPDFKQTISYHRYVSNIPWLVEMALDDNESGVQFFANITY